MSFSRNQLIAVIGFLIILISIPVSFSVISKTQIFRSRAAEPKNTSSTGSVTQPRPVPSASPLTDLQKALQDISKSTSSSSPAPIPEMSLAFGPTLNLTVSIEGRPANKQAGKVFVGLSGGNAMISPTFILTFTIDMPDSGIFKGLSLAGLNPGSIYTAYIKGESQIDSASTFTMSPTESNLNNNAPLTLISGDLNEDNTINSADYSIARNLYGSRSSSANWNSRADFNKDNLINNYDLAFITKNMGKTGSSGPWVSTPKSSSSSASLTNMPNVGGPPANFGEVLQASTTSASNPSGYWIRVP